MSNSMTLKPRSLSHEEISQIVGEARRARAEAYRHLAQAIKRRVVALFSGRPSDHGPIGDDAAHCH